MILAGNPAGNYHERIMSNHIINSGIFLQFRENPFSLRDLVCPVNHNNVTVNWLHKKTPRSGGVSKNYPDYLFIKPFFLFIITVDAVADDLFHFSIAV